MKLLSLRMQNIKTYVDETIDFSEGINCILGLNGGGKSTIIESIGYALFGYCKGKNSQMVRHGEKQGEIDLEFIANDGCRYRIEKVIKKKGASKSSMYDDKEMIFDKDSEINGCVKRVLKIQTTQKLDKIFADVVAVPQGKYVSIFLENDSDKKKEFDKLLGFDEYTNISNKLRDLKQYVVSSEKEPLMNEISEIKGMCSNYEANIKEHKSLKKELAKLEKEFEEIKANLLVAKKAYEAYENQSLELEKIKQKIAIFETKIKSKNELINREKILLENAKKSYEIVQKNADFYAKFNENSERILMLENSSKNHAKNQEKLVEISQEIARINEQISLSKNDIETSKKDIENRLEELARKVENIEQKDIEILALKDDIDSKNKMLSNKVEDSNKLEKRNSLDSKALIRFKERINNIPEVDSNFQELEEEKEKLILKKEQIDNAKKELDIVNNQISRLFAENLQKQELLDLSVDGLCPIFKTKCNNTNKDISCEIKEQMNDISKKIGDLEKKQSELQDIIKFENENIGNLYGIDEQIKDYTIVKELINSLCNDINDYYLVSISSLDDAKELILEKEKELQDNENRYVSLKEEIKNDNEMISPLMGSYIQKVAQNDNEKKNISKEQNDIKKIELDIDKKVAKIKELDIKLDKLKNEKVDIEKLLSETSKNVNEIEALRKENDEISSKKDMYLSNISEANKLDEYVNTINSLEKENDIDKNELNSLKNSYEEYANQFDQDKKDKALEEKEILTKEEASLKTKIEETNKAFDKLVLQILSQEALLKKKEEIDRKINKCDSIIDFIEKARSVYKELPQALSKTYREGISNIASSLYRSISKDNYKIDINENYNINLINMINPDDSTNISFLSGGEQMSVAIAVRLAMLKYLTNLDIYFLDEPTVNLDYERRVRVGEVVEEVSKNLSQVFVISHDDTFDSISQNLIKVLKTDGISKIME